MLPPHFVGDVCPVVNLGSAPLTLKMRDIRRSLWIGWTCTFLLNWVAFLWIGFRARDKKLAAFGVGYFGIVLQNFVISGITGGRGAVYGSSLVVLLFAAVASIVHAFAVRRSYLARLDALVRGREARVPRVPRSLRHLPVAVTRARRGMTKVFLATPLPAPLEADDAIDSATPHAPRKIELDTVPVPPDGEPGGTSEHRTELVAPQPVAAAQLDHSRDGAQAGLATPEPVYGGEARAAVSRHKNLGGLPTWAWVLTALGLGVIALVIVATATSNNRTAAAAVAYGKDASTKQGSLKISFSKLYMKDGVLTIPLTIQNDDSADRYDYDVNQSFSVNYPERGKDYPASVDGIAVGTLAPGEARSVVLHFKVASGRCPNNLHFQAINFSSSSGDMPITGIDCKSGGHPATQTVPPTASSAPSRESGPVSAAPVRPTAAPTLVPTVANTRAPTPTPTPTPMPTPTPTFAVSVSGRGTVQATIGDTITTEITITNTGSRIIKSIALTLHGYNNLPFIGSIPSAQYLNSFGIKALTFNIDVEAGKTVVLKFEFLADSVNVYHNIVFPSFTNDDGSSITGSTLGFTTVVR